MIRSTQKQTVAVTADASTTGIVKWGDRAGGMVYVPTGSPITTLIFHVAPGESSDDVFLPAYDDTPTTPVAITLTGLSGGRAYPLPVKIFGTGAFKMVGNDAGNVIVTRKD